MLKIGLLGAGRIGFVHAKAISTHPKSALVAVSDVRAQSAADLAREFGTEVRTSDEIIADPGIDAVLIATSTDTHSELIEAATKAGKAVLCEKPVDLDLARAQACQSVADASGQPVMVGFNRRFDHNFAALKKALDDGEIGKSELLSVTSFDPGPPPLDYVRVSGGLFRDMMIHDFDIATWLMGALPDTVHAVGSSLVDPEIGAAGDVDTAVVTLQYANGRIAVIRNSRRAVFGYDQRIELLGSEGMLQAENVLENTLRKSTVDGVIAAKPVLFFLERYMPAYRAEWDAFVTAVQDNTPVPVGMKEGVAALALAEAATRSAQSGSPVALAEILD